MFRLPDKRRPVLILTRDEVIDRLNEIIVVPATRTIRGLTTEVVLTTGDGMPIVCALNFDHVALAQRDRIGPALYRTPFAARDGGSESNISVHRQLAASALEENPVGATLPRMGGRQFEVSVIIPRALLIAATKTVGLHPGLSVLFDIEQEALFVCGCTQT
jgi:mRNA interferase MazF